MNPFLPPPFSSSSASAPRLKPPMKNGKAEVARAEPILGGAKERAKSHFMQAYGDCRSRHDAFAD